MRRSFLGKTIVAAAAVLSMLAVSCKKDSSPNNGYGSSGGGGSTVSMQYNRFNPSALTISRGTTVTWTNRDNVTHTVTSSTGAFNSGDVTSGKSFSYTFSAAGTFDYYCKYHQSMGMTGTVVVQ